MGREVFTIKSRTIALGTLPAFLLLVTVSRSLRAADRLEIWPVASLAEQLTDNLPQQTTSGASSDAISLLNLGASATVDSEHRTFGLDYNTDTQVYARNSSLDRVFQDQYVGVRDYERVSARTGVSLNDTFINGQQTFGQSLIGPAAATPLLSQALLQSTFLTNTFNLQVTHAWSERASTVLSVHQAFFSTSGSQTSSSFSQGGELAGYYQVFPRLSVGPDFQFNDFRFSNQPRQDSLQPSLAINWNRSKHLVTSARIGPIIFLSANETRLDFGYMLNTSYVGERWLFSLSSGRTPSISAGLSGASISQYEGAAAQYQVSRRTSVYVNASFNRFSQTTNNSYGIAFSTGINHQVTRSIAIFGQFVRFQSNSPSLNGKVTDTVTFGIKFTPQPWQWMF